MGEDGPMGEKGEKVCKIHFLKIIFGAETKKPAVARKTEEYEFNVRHEGEKLQRAAEEQRSRVVCCSQQHLDASFVLKLDLIPMFSFGVAPALVGDNSSLWHLVEFGTTSNKSWIVQSCILHISAFCFAESGSVSFILSILPLISPLEPRL